MKGDWKTLEETGYDEALNQYELRNTEFIDQIFERLEIFRWGEQPSVLFENVLYKNCTVKYAFVIDSGCTFRNVIFDNFSHAELNMGANNVMDKLTFKGSKLKRLYVRREENLPKDIDKEINEENLAVDTMLDISEFKANDLEIFGIPRRKVKYNPERHYLMAMDRIGDVPEDDQLVHGSGFFSSKIRHIHSLGYEEGIFNYPKPSHAKFDQIMSEAEELRRRGVILES